MLVLYQDCTCYDIVVYLCHLVDLLLWKSNFELEFTTLVLKLINATMITEKLYLLVIFLVLCLLGPNWFLSWLPIWWVLIHLPSIDILCLLVLLVGARILMLSLERVLGIFRLLLHSNVLIFLGTLLFCLVFITAIKGVVVIIMLHDFILVSL